MKKRIISIFLILISLVSFTTLSYANDNAKDTGIPVLTYHHILFEQENICYVNDMVITPETFRWQMYTLNKYGYTVLTLDQLEEYLDGKLEVPKKSVVITFDDGYLSNYRYAYPILKQLGYKASLFAVVSAINKTPQQFDPLRLTKISWEEIPKYRDVFSIESHTYDMHKVENGKGYIAFKPKQEVYLDLKKSKDMLNSKYFAYPYGSWGPQTIEVLKELEFHLAFTTKSGSVHRGDSKLTLPRYIITDKITVKEFRDIIGLKEN